MSDIFKHLSFTHEVVEQDLAYIDKKDRSYGASWKKRGGVGAFMMLARKWDRLENMMQKEGVKYDIFACIEMEEQVQGEDGTALAEIRDLRRYLILVEAEMMARYKVDSSQRKRGKRGTFPLEDSNKHALQAQDNGDSV